MVWTWPKVVDKQKSQAAAGEILAGDLGRQFFRVLSRCRLLRVSVVWGTHGVRTLAHEIVAKRRSRLKIA